MQRSESFLLCALLSFSGGLQDAYTYNVRGNVFANAQTGNVVLMSQNFMCGEWLQGLYYLCPLVFFACGVFAAERIESRYKSSKKLHWRQIILFIEMAALAIVGLLPVDWNVAANMLVSFSCAMQVQTFRKVHGYGYASTMCIGNLRSGTESLSQYLRSGDQALLYKALYFFRHHSGLCGWRGNGRRFVRCVWNQDHMDLRSHPACSHGCDDEREMDQYGF